MSFTKRFRLRTSLHVPLFVKFKNLLVYTTSIIFIAETLLVPWIENFYSSRLINNRKGVDSKASELIVYDLELCNICRVDYLAGLYTDKNIKPPNAW
jgi:hypothetical protein